MKKPWSITTTLRNPDRIRSFLMTLSGLEGEEWNKETQQRYQISLIRDRNYGYGSTQFYNGLTQNHIDLIDDQSKEISFDVATSIFNSKNYKDPSMRGRQSFNPIKKIGLATIVDQKIKITDLGKSFLKDDFDYGQIFLRSFLKWQLPNPSSNDYKKDDGYNIKPFIGILHLIDQVNIKSRLIGEKEKGISKQEFALFCPTLINFNQIDLYSDKIIELRKEQKGKPKKEKIRIFKIFQDNFLKQFLDYPNQEEINSLIKNLKDYGDNAIRYFRLTRFLYIRGGGFYIDLEKRRRVEIDNLLSFDNGESEIFESEKDYFKYIADISKPELPWESKSEYKKIISEIVVDIQSYELNLQLDSKEVLDYQNLKEEELKKYIFELRLYRRDLQERKNHRESQGVTQISHYIEILDRLSRIDRSLEDRPILLEKFSSLGLNALNDALKIKPNYPVGDDNEPTFTAPANTPDIECYYKKFNAVCEVTMLNSRDQWYSEGQPVMRHLRDFENNNLDKDSYCLFIAPKIHRDTLNTFWMAVKYEYEGKKQKIVPLTISNFVKLLKILIKIKEAKKTLKHQEIQVLYDSIIMEVENHSDSQEWLLSIDSLIDVWESGMLKIH